MKKKFLSLILAFAFIIPLAFGLVGCGDNNDDSSQTPPAETITYTVTEQDWKTQIDSIKNSKNFYLDEIFTSNETNSNENPIYSKEQNNIVGNKFIYQGGKINGVSVSQGRYYAVWESETDNNPDWYKLENEHWKLDESGETGGNVTFDEASKIYYLDYKMQISEIANNFDDFGFYSTTNTYKATSIRLPVRNNPVYTEGASGNETAEEDPRYIWETYDKVEVKFENNKIVSLSFESPKNVTDNTQSPAATIEGKEIVKFYDFNKTITLPTEIIALRNQTAE